jgi:TorA maturation chaperone TorD
MQTVEQVLPAELAPARVAVYRFLLAALDKPAPGQHAWLRGADFLNALALLGESFGVACPGGELFPEAFADHESRYLACFEVGLPEPPVVLLASHYNRREPVPRVIHEHLLFYRYFGIRPPTANGEPADHLSHQLAFLIRLDELLTSRVADARSLLRARHDFLSRHVLAWAGRAAAAAEEKHLPPVYRALLALLARAAGQDHQLTAAALADLNPENR